MSLAVCALVSVLAQGTAATVLSSDSVTYPTGLSQQFGDAVWYGSMSGRPLGGPISSMAVTPDGHGYWLTGTDGGVFAYGDAPFLGSMGGSTLAAPVVSIAADADGHGYRLAATDGGVFAFGEAVFAGSMAGRALAGPIVAMAATPDGGGYWLAATDGGIFAFGDAHYFGSMGGTPLNRQVVGFAATPDGGGYWEVAADGGIFSFGDAAFFGSLGATPLAVPVTTMAATHDGRGYWLAGADGGVFAFGDARYVGSANSSSSPDPVLALAPTPDDGGYWLVRGPPPMPGWVLPGSVISNLDRAPASPYAAGSKVVALTFDDGPSSFTGSILSELVAAGVHATFSVEGGHAAAMPDVVSQELNDGMSVVNHSWSHRNLVDLSPTAVAQEIDLASAEITMISGHEPQCMRPPYESAPVTLPSMLRSRGLAELLWDVDPRDWTMPGIQVLVSRVLGALHPGAIVLLHDGGGDRSQTVAALPAIIAGISAAGYAIVPVCGQS